MMTTVSEQEVRAECMVLAAEMLGLAERRAEIEERAAELLEAMIEETGEEPVGSDWVSREWWDHRRRDTWGLTALLCAVDLLVPAGVGIESARWALKELRAI